MFKTRVKERAMIKKPNSIYDYFNGEYYNYYRSELLINESLYMEVEIVRTELHIAEIKEDWNRRKEYMKLKSLINKEEVNLSSGSRKRL